MTFQMFSPRARTRITLVPHVSLHILPEYIFITRPSFQEETGKRLAFVWNVRRLHPLTRGAGEGGGGGRERDSLSLASPTGKRGGDV